MLETRLMVEGDFDEVAELIFLSTNSWYEAHLGHRIFTGRPEECRVFCEVYEDLDPESALVVENSATGAIVGSCFCHPRETHVSLGIMNVHPNYFGRGIAGRLLQQIIDLAESRDLPVRLVSSALNLDSYSLYNRLGFVPFATYQDLLLEIPEEGFEEPEQELPTVRPAELPDLVEMGTVEFEVAGISRERDYCYFLENSKGLWETWVVEDGKGGIDGFLVSLSHPASRMIGPGVCRTTDGAEALLRAQFDRFRGSAVVFLLPARENELIRRCYDLGARNCELHFGQVRGEAQPIEGVVFPTFLPESG
ncbi:MAG: GNAT family N-acetyltransferase [Verrucomicrobiota bacterium]